MLRPVRISTLPTYLFNCSREQFTHIISCSLKVAFEEAMETGEATEEVIKA